MFLIVKCMHPDDGDTQAPTAPAHLRASNITSSSVDLQWDASTDNLGVIEYDIYKGDTLAGTTKNTSYTAGSLSAGTDYSFFVFAKDAAGNISPHSNIVKVSTLSDYAVSTKAVSGDSFQSGNLIYTILNDEEVSVKAADTSISGHVRIPDSLVVTIEGIRNYKVTEIADHGFYGCKSLTGIDIPNHVTMISAFAFANCSILSSINIQIGLKAIEAGVFSDCIALTTVNIPASVIMINPLVFYDCSSLEDVRVNWTDASNIVNIESKNLFSGISSSAVLHIPAGMKSAYAAKGWGEGFAEVLEDE